MTCIFMTQVLHTVPCLDYWHMKFFTFHQERPLNMAKPSGVVVTRKLVKDTRAPEEKEETTPSDIAQTFDVTLWSTLPEGLAEEVIARLPFNLFFRCYLLARAAKMHEKALKDTIATRKFEEVITSVSTKWPTFCPVYLFREGLVGFNNQTETWQKVFDLKMFPFIPKGVYTTRVTSCAGSLVSLASVNFSSAEGVDIEAYKEWVHWKYRLLDHEVYVANVVTRKWRILPPRPNMQRPDIMHMVQVGGGDYKLFLLTQLGHVVGVPSVISTQVYNSVSNSWTESCSQALMPNWKTSLSNFAYYSGVFFIATGSRDYSDPPVLMTHDVVKGTWGTMIPPLSLVLQNVMKYHVLLCGSELLLVVRLLSPIPTLCKSPDDDPFVRTNSFQIFKLDLASGQIKEEAKCPLEGGLHVSFDQVTAAGDCIYFGGRYIPGTPLIKYNVTKREWSYHNSAWQWSSFTESCLPTWNGQTYSREPRLYYWAHYGLQPGLNPFAEV
ncbi:hypothetical protein R1sor_026017 [Riccia sorocarpa]|uniref:F-box domain-containing protein n=1 Tax=Riccia sorocarpa TaxID=122646 RepID=A0ABD3GFW5_9MARC